MTYADKELKILEQKIKKLYTQSYMEMKGDMAKIMVQISVNPNMSTQQKIALMNKYDRLDKLTKQVTEVLNNTNKMAQRFVNNSMVNVYKNAYNTNAEALGFAILDNTAVKKVLKHEVNPFTAINSLKDKTAIQNKLKGDLLTGILQGDSIPQIAMRLKHTSEQYLNDAVKVARTETTRVENSAHLDVGQAGKKKGFNMWKRWVATADPRTREAHALADGQEVPIDEPFIVGGEELMYPGDLAGSPENVINCRCTMVSFIKEK